MAEGGVAQIMPHGDGLGQILVQAQGTGHGAGNPGHLQGVGHAGTVVISFRAEKHLGFVHQTPEGFAVYDAVVVPLEAGAYIIL